MASSPWAALADALEVLAHTLRTMTLTRALPASLTPEHAPDVWLTVRQFSERHPAFPRGTVASLVYARGGNGLLAQGIVKEVLKRKVIIHEARFLAWLLREPVPQRGHLIMTPPKQGRRAQG